MSIWILLAVIAAGVLAIIGLACFITHDLDDQGEPREREQ